MLNWTCSNCAAYDEAKGFDAESDEWMAFVNLREALIYALLATKFPPKSAWKITADNWKNVFKRLRMLEEVIGPYRGMGDRSMNFTAEEVHSMIGLEVNAGNQTDLEFAKTILAMAWWRRSQQDSELALSNFEQD